jgi:hypothetical protein
MRRLLLLATLLAGVASPAVAQRGARVEVTVDPATRDPRVRVRNLMNEARWREALDDAFRISLHWRVELWKQRWPWSSNQGEIEFTTVIRREPLLGQYFITYFIEGRDPTVLTFSNLDAFVLQLEGAIDINRMAPRTDGRWYYVANLQVSALDEEQFAELQRFIGGGGGGNGGGGLSGWLLRRVGLPSQNLPAARSARFEVP